MTLNVCQRCLYFNSHYLNTCALMYLYFSLCGFELRILERWRILIRVCRMNIRVSNLFEILLFICTISLRYFISFELLRKGSWKYFSAVSAILICTLKFHRFCSLLLQLTQIHTVQERSQSKNLKLQISVSEYLARNSTKREKSQFLRRENKFK